MTCVVIGEAEVYACDIDYLANWIGAGYRLFGIADEEDIEALYCAAQLETQ